MILKKLKKLKEVQIQKNICKKRVRGLVYVCVYVCIFLMEEFIQQNKKNPIFQEQISYL